MTLNVSSSAGELQCKILKKALKSSKNAERLLEVHLTTRKPIRGSS